MVFNLVFLLLPIVVSSMFPSQHRRIHFGEKATTKQPYLASLLYDHGTGTYHLSCGGLVFSEFYVVTAAHCITMFGDQINLVGVDGLNFNRMGAYHKIIDKIAHPDFTDKQIEGRWILDADIGLVKTETRMKNFVPAISYEPSQGSLEGKPIIIYGWGITETGATSQDLKLLDLEVLSDFYYCENDPVVQAGRAFCFWTPVGNGQTGSGDSGSPIMLKAANPNEQATVVSLLSATSGPFVKDGAEFFVEMGPNFTYFLPWLTESMK